MTSYLTSRYIGNSVITLRTFQEGPGDIDGSAPAFLSNVIKLATKQNLTGLQLTNDLPLSLSGGYPRLVGATEVCENGPVALCTQPPAQELTHMYEFSTLALAPFEQRLFKDTGHISLPQPMALPDMHLGNLFHAGVASSLPSPLMLTSVTARSSTTSPLANGDCPTLDYCSQAWVSSELKARGFYDFTAPRPLVEQLELAGHLVTTSEAATAPLAVAFRSADAVRREEWRPVERSCASGNGSSCLPRPAAVSAVLDSWMLVANPGVVSLAQAIAAACDIRPVDSAAWAMVIPSLLPESVPAIVLGRIAATDLTAPYYTDRSGPLVAARGGMRSGAQVSIFMDRRRPAAEWRVQIQGGSPSWASRAVDAVYTRGSAGNRQWTAMAALLTPVSRQIRPNKAAPLLSESGGNKDAAFVVAVEVPHNSTLGPKGYNGEVLGIMADLGYPSVSRMLREAIGVTGAADRPCLVVTGQPTSLRQTPGLRPDLACLSSVSYIPQGASVVQRLHVNPSSCDSAFCHFLRGINGMWLILLQTNALLNSSCMR